jgi:hypothetical protein
MELYIAFSDINKKVVATDKIKAGGILSVAGYPGYLLLLLFFFFHQVRIYHSRQVFLPDILLDTRSPID